MLGAAKTLIPRIKGEAKIKLRLAEKKLFAALLAVAFVVCGLLVLVPEVKADITGSRTFFSTSADAQLSYLTTDWATGWNAYYATWDDAAGQLLVGGVEYGSGQWNIARSCLYFTTVDVPADATITAATLSLYVETDNSVNDFNVTIQGTSLYPHSPAQASDYYRGWYGSTSLGSRSTGDGLSAQAFWNVSLNAAGLALINREGTSRFIIRNQNDIDGTAPSSNEWIYVSARDRGESYAAKLIVEYTVPSSDAYNYYFQGPYDDSGNLIEGTVHVVVTPSYNTPIEFDLTSDGLTADTETVSLEQQAILATWNITTAGNYTRVHYFNADTTETIYVCVPDPNLPFNLYSFTVNDFVGVTSGHLESTLYIDGATRVIERQQINTIGPAPFYMTWSKVYDMRVVADQGTVGLGSFTALTDTSPTAIIPAGAFPHAFEGLDVLVTASRTNATTIQVSYADSQEATYWVRVYIKHRLSNGDYYTDYYENSTDNSYSLTWQGGANFTDYLVQVQAFRGNATKDWSFLAPYQRGPSSLWGGLNLLGDGLPIEAQYIPAVVLIFAAALAFSFWHISAGAWIAWVTAVVCTLFNWLPTDPVSTPITLGIGAVICAGITIGEFKKGERTL